jgi:hypothetical protein
MHNERKRKIEVLPPLPTEMACGIMCAVVKEKFQLNKKDTNENQNQQGGSFRSPQQCAVRS